MVKQYLGLSFSRKAAILAALLCGQGHALLFAQESAQPAADQSNISTSPSETSVPGAEQSPDQDLARQIRQQFASDTAFQSIEVNVINGVAILEGPVASKSDRKRAVNRVKVLPNVSRIDDRLTINAQAVKGASANTYAASNAAFDAPMPNAAEVANEIIDAVADEPALATSRVNVTVAGDIIELTGTVRSKKQRDRIRDIANSFAVHSRVVDRLKVVAQNNDLESK
jgi:osmotically-inducible protein OsmY